MSLRSTYGNLESGRTIALSFRLKAGVLAGSIALAANMALLSIAGAARIITGQGGLLRLFATIIQRLAGALRLTDDLNNLHLPSQAVFHILTGLAMAVAYALMIEPRLVGRPLYKGLVYGAAVWCFNAFLVLPLIGEGIAGSWNVNTVGLIVFAVAHMSFFLALSVLYEILLYRSGFVCARGEFLQQKYVHVKGKGTMNNYYALPRLRTASKDRSVDMNPLLNEVLDAHGGLTQWKRFTKISATIRSGGDLWKMKGVPQDPSPRQMSASLDKEWSSVFPYGSPNKLTDFTPNRVAIVTIDGRLVAERFDPAGHAEGKDINAPWDALDRAYFNGYALWTYLNVPFLLSWPGFDVVEIPSWQEVDEEWRGLRATFPPHIASHSKEQDFYFGADGLLRRHDYYVNASGGFAATQYVSSFIEVEGIRLPTTRRAYMRGGNLKPLTDRLMVSIDLSDFRLW